MSPEPATRVKARKPRHNPRATWWAARAFRFRLESEGLTGPAWVTYTRRCEDAGVNVPTLPDGQHVDGCECRGHRSDLHTAI
jgi:hypothetical protein